MKRMSLIIGLLFLTLCLTGCNKGKVEDLSENMKKIELTGNLVTYEAYYHNVIEYEKEADSGITHIFEKDRKLFMEYSGTIKLGIDFSKVKITVTNNVINVFIPEAKIIGEPNVDRKTFIEENIIESKDGINKNKISADDLDGAFVKAQNNMKKNALSDETLLTLAQDRAKIIIEENIKEFSNLNDNQYSINWELE